MPLSIEEKKERHKEATKKWREANKDKILDKHKEYRIANKEILKESKKKYRDVNKQKIKENPHDLKENVEVIKRLEDIKSQLLNLKNSIG